MQPDSLLNEWSSNNVIFQRRISKEYGDGEGAEKHVAEQKQSTHVRDALEVTSKLRLQIVLGHEKSNATSPAKGAFQSCLSNETMSRESKGTMESHRIEEMDVVDW